MKIARLSILTMCLLAASCTGNGYIHADFLPRKILTRGSVNEEVFMDTFRYFVYPGKVLDKVGADRALQEIIDSGWALNAKLIRHGNSGDYSVKVHDFTIQEFWPASAFNLKSGVNLSCKYTHAIFKKDYTLKARHIENLFPAMRPIRLRAEFHFRKHDEKITPAGDVYAEKRLGGTITAYLNAGRITPGGGFLTHAIRLRHENAKTEPVGAGTAWNDDEITAGTYFVTVDFRDSILYPTDGTFIEGALETASSKESSGIFNRYWLDCRGYVSPSTGHVFAARHFHGRTSGTTPAGELFEAGSPFFGEYTTYRTYFGRGIPFGSMTGTSVDCTSLEYRLHAHRLLQIGLFYDFGWLGGKAFNSTGISGLFFDVFRLEFSWDDKDTKTWWFEHRWSF